MYSIYEYIRGAFGSFSITTMLLLAGFLLQRLFGRRLISNADRSAILYGAAMTGVVLYPTALGLLPVDAYRLGYRPVFLLLLFLVLAISMWLLKYRAVGMFIVIAVIFFNLHALESYNLWDYLIDPFVALYALGWTIYQLKSQSFKTFKTDNG